MNVAPVGVGSTGIVAVTPFRASTVGGNVELPGVIGEASAKSTCATDRFLIFRLVNDTFFRRTSGAVIAFSNSLAGDAGIGGSLSSLSCDIELSSISTGGSSPAPASMSFAGGVGAEVGCWVVWAAARMDQAAGVVFDSDLKADIEPLGAVFGGGCGFWP